MAIFFCMSGVLARLKITYPEMHDPVMSDESKPKDFYYEFHWEILDPTRFQEDDTRLLKRYELELLKKRSSDDEILENNVILVIGEFIPKPGSQHSTTYYRAVYVKFKEPQRNVDNIHAMHDLQNIVQQTIYSYAANLNTLYQDDYTFENEMVMTDTKIKWEVLSRLSNIISSMLTQKGFKTIY